MTKLTNRIKEVNKENNFEAVRLPAPDILRTRWVFSNQGFFNLKFKFTVKAIIFYDNMARWKPYMEQSSTRSTIFVILLTTSPRNIISWILRQRKRQIESSTVHLDVLITIMTVFNFLTAKQVDHEKDFFSATILI